jgi:hypothetical protein
MAAMKPRMSAAELTLFSNAIAGKSYAIEYGLGGSTFLMIDAGVETIYSVESDPAWIREVLEHERMRSHAASGRLSVSHADIGPTTQWGHPANDSKRSGWPDYWREPWHRVDAARVDLVIVDGRFRVACILNSLLEGTKDMTIVVHDFWNRPEYHAVLPFLNCACRADSLAVFFPRARWDGDALQRELQRSAFTPV